VFGRKATGEFAKSFNPNNNFSTGRPIITNSLLFWTSRQKKLGCKIVQISFLGKPGNFPNTHYALNIFSTCQPIFTSSIQIELAQQVEECGSQNNAPNFILGGKRLQTENRQAGEQTMKYAVFFGPVYHTTHYLAEAVLGAQTIIYAIKIVEKQRMLLLKILSSLKYVC
jgi:hypothetical protein